MQNSNIKFPSRLFSAKHLTIMMILGLIFVQPATLLAQTEDGEVAQADTTRLDFPGKTLTIISEPKEEDDEDVEEPNDNEGSDTDDMTFWSGVDLGLSGFLSADNELNLPENLEQYDLDYAKSVSVHLNFIEHKFRLVKNYVGLNTGLGLEYNSYAFKNDVSLSVMQDTLLNVFDTVRNYDKNKLKATYLVMPLMLEFNTSKYAEKSVHLAVGIVGGWRIGSKWKHQYETDEERVKNKVKSHYHLNPFKYSAAVRVGYGGLTVFANYGLSTLFEKDKGPELYPFNVGITLTGI